MTNVLNGTVARVADGMNSAIVLAANISIGANQRSGIFPMEYRNDPPLRLLPVARATSASQGRMGAQKVHTKRATENMHSYGKAN